MPKSTTAPRKPADHAAKASKSYGITKASLTDLDLPSGDFVQARQPGLQGLIKAGILENLDSLTAIVATETIPKAQGQTPSTPKIPDAQQITDALLVMDKVVAYVVVQPKVHLDPTDADLAAYNAEHEDAPLKTADDLRDPDLLYTSDVSVDDKSFITQFAMGGTRDLQTFREKSAAAVGSVSARA